MRLIDADALMKEFQEPVLVRSDEWDGWHKCFALVLKTINRLPTIEERKKGKWEEREVSSEKVIDEWQSARCSVCGKYHTTPYMYYFDNFSFCPNCGAYTKGGE